MSAVYEYSESPSPRTYSMSTVRVQYEYSMSTVRVQYEYSMSQ
jgi:hypothetical protein